MDFKQYADETMDFIREIEADGCRFPGSPEEKAASVKIQKIIEGKTGIKPRTEKFIFAPNASIGAIGRLGWVAIALLVLYYISASATLLALVGYVGILAFAVIQIVLYKGWFDSAFKQECSENIITELLPESGKVDYTIYLGAHYDSSWCWKLAVKNPDTAILKALYGIIGILAMIALSITKLCVSFGASIFPSQAAYVVYTVFTLVVPVLFLPGFFFVTQFTSHDKTIGSPGAMDNLSGIGINMAILQYFKENPDKLPENCRLVNIGFAAEEAGLKGSAAYVKAHKNDGSLADSYVINVDSVADPDHFEVIKADTWQGTRFDSTLTALALDSMRESGVKEPKAIANPVGGCDSTPFCKIGVPTITIAAQNPRSTDYYHTCNDKSSRIAVSTLETGISTVYTLIQKIGVRRADGNK